MLADDPDKSADAPSTIGIVELTLDNLSLTKLYLALAKRHDALVDAVEKYLIQQAK